MDNCRYTVMAMQLYPIASPRLYEATQNYVKSYLGLPFSGSSATWCFMTSIRMSILLGNNDAMHFMQTRLTTTKAPTAPNHNHLEPKAQSQHTLRFPVPNTPPHSLLIRVLLFEELDISFASQLIVDHTVEA